MALNRVSRGAGLEGGAIEEDKQMTPGDNWRQWQHWRWGPPCSQRAELQVHGEGSAMSDLSGTNGLSEWSGAECLMFTASSPKVYPR